MFFGPDENFADKFPVTEGREAVGFKGGIFSSSQTSTGRISAMHPLRTFALIAVATLMVACTEGKPPHAQSWKDATGAEAYERSFWKAIEERDFASAERRLAPIFNLTTPEGIAAREKAIEYFRALNLQHIDIGDVRVDPEGADMVVTYVATLETKSSSAPVRYFMTTVWQQVKSGWIAISHSEVRANS